MTNSRWLYERDDENKKFEALSILFIFFFLDHYGIDEEMMEQI